MSGIFHGILLTYIFVFPNTYIIEEYAGEMYVEKRKKTDSLFTSDTLPVCQYESVCSANDGTGGAGSNDAFLCGYGGFYRAGYLRTGCGHQKESGQHYEDYDAAYHI